MAVALYREQIVMTKWGILVGESIFTGDGTHSQRLELDPATRLKAFLLRVDSILPAVYQLQVTFGVK